MYCFSTITTVTQTRFSVMFIRKQPVLSILKSCYIPRLYIITINSNLGWLIRLLCLCVQCASRHEVLNPQSNNPSCTVIRIYARKLSINLNNIFWLGLHVLGNWRYHGSWNTRYAVHQVITTFKTPGMQHIRSLRHSQTRCAAQQIITTFNTPGMQHTRSLWGHSTHTVCSTPYHYDIQHTSSHVHIIYSKRTHLLSRC